jgi:hypothetical protein
MAGAHRDEDAHHLLHVHLAPSCVLVCAVQDLAGILAEVHGVVLHEEVHHYIRGVLILGVPALLHTHAGVTV